MHKEWDTEEILWLQMAWTTRKEGRAKQKEQNFTSAIEPLY